MIEHARDAVAEPVIASVMNEEGIGGMSGKPLPVLISILPMKGRRSPFIIITIRFMANTENLFAGYGATPVIK
jgi:hypothetical protein